MSIQLSFTPSVGFELIGPIDLDGVSINIESMSEHEAAITDMGKAELTRALPALSGFLGVSVTLKVDGVTQTFEPEEPTMAPDLLEANQVVDEIFEGILDNVFDMDFTLSLDIPGAPSAPLAEVVPIKPLDIPEDEIISLWESLFTKPVPVLSRMDWANSPESDYYVYSPNDASKPEGDREDCTKNTELTYLMLQVYKRVCLLKGINPAITLQSGEGPFNVLSLDAFSGLQPAVSDERAARLANSSIDIDDSYLIPDFLAILKAFPVDELESEVAHLNLLVKAEMILIGTSSRMTNHAVVRKLCNLAEANFAMHGSFMEGNTSVLNAIIFTLRQMVIEDKVMESSKQHFITCMVRAGLREHTEDLSKLFDMACSR